MANYNIDAIYNGGTSLPGTERIRIDSSGNVGIGTASPGAKLDVSGGSYNTGIIIRSNDTLGSGVGLINSDTGGKTWYIISTASSNTGGAGHLGFFNATDNFYRLYIKSDGNVGLGTTSPTQRLQLGDFTSTSTATPETINFGATYSNTAGANLKLRIYDDNNGVVGGMGVSNGQVEVNTWATGKIAFYRGTTQSAIIDTNGNVGIGTTSPTQLLEVNGTSPIIRVLATSGNSTLRLTDNGVRNWDLKVVDVNDYFEVGGTSATSLVVTGAGNVGIGTTSPSVKLTVSGDVTDSDVGQFRAVGSTSAAKMINVGYHTTSNYGFISALIAGTGYSALSLQPNGGNVGIATVSPDVRLHVINGTTKLNKNNYKTTTAYSTADLVLGDDISSRTGYAGNGSNLVLHANGTTSITFLDQTRNLGEITYSNRLFTIGGDIGWGTASVSFPGTVNFGTNIYHSIGGQKFFAGSGGNYAYIYTGGVALNFLNSTDTSTLMTVLNGGNVGIGTTSPAFALDVTGGVGLNTSGTGVSVTIGANNTSDRYLRIRNSNGNFEIGSAGNQHYLYGIGASNYFSIYTNVTERMRITADGVVLIGATSAYNSSRLLQVKDGLLIGNSLYTFASIDTNSSADLILSSNANPANLGANSNIIFKLGTSGGGGPTERMRIVSDGNVGIGTTSPTFKLFVNGGVGIPADNVINFGSASQIYYNSTSTGLQFTGSSGNNTVFIRAADGNVGIGTTNPTQKLEVAGYVLSNVSAGVESGFYLGNSGHGTRRPAGTNDVYLYTSSGTLYLGANGNSSQHITINNSGNVGIGTTSPSSRFHVQGNITLSTTNIRNDWSSVVWNLSQFNSNTTTTPSYYMGFQTDVANNRRFYISNKDDDVPHGGDPNGGIIFRTGTGPSERMVITYGGNVGIGTTSPTTKLEVIGNIAAFVNGADTITRGIYIANAANTKAFNFQLNSGGTNLDLWSYNSAGAWVRRVSFNYDGNVGIGTTAPSSTLYVTGNVGISGNITKGGGSFLIEHPDPAKQGWKLQHSFVESPTVGDNIYRYEITINETLQGAIELPDYWKHLNENPQIWISPVKHFGIAYGEISEDVSSLTVFANSIGKYNILLIGTRKDPTIKKIMADFAVERKPE